MLIALFLSLFLIHQDTYLEEITEFRKSLTSTFKNPFTSPLRAHERKQFKTHTFFPINRTFRVKASLKRTPQSPRFLMKTNTQRRAEYRIYGIATFRLNEDIYRVQILEHVDSDDSLLFPFTDLTNGNTSYSGGRYINIKRTNADFIFLDFNKSYNPYCAYNPTYSCPVPPKENHINMNISTGIQFTKKKH